MPGFVNGHVHMYGVLAHGIPLESAPSDFWSFLEKFWWPLVEDRIDHEKSAGGFVHLRPVETHHQMGVLHDFSKPRQHRARGCSGYG